MVLSLCSSHTAILICGARIIEWFSWWFCPYAHLTLPFLSVAQGSLSGFLDGSVPMLISHCHSYLWRKDHWVVFFTQHWQWVMEFWCKVNCTYGHNYPLKCVCSERFVRRGVVRMFGGSRQNYDNQAVICKHKSLYLSHRFFLLINTWAFINK